MNRTRMFRTVSLSLLGATALAFATTAAVTEPPTPAPAPSPPAAAEAQHLVVPLSAPDRPARVVAELLMGSITVEVGGAREVTIDAVPEPESDARRGRERTRHQPPEKAAGMRRLAGGGFELEVEEENNVVEIESQSFRGAVRLHLRVPEHTDLALEVTNGSIVVHGVDGAHELASTNGGIEATGVSGSIVAETTNGDVTAVLDRVVGDRPLAFASFNGDVDVTLPADHRADLRLRTQNGDIYTDFDVALSSAPRVEQERHEGRYRVLIDKEVRGKLAGGGPELRLETFNGSIYLRRPR